MSPGVSFLVAAATVSVLPGCLKPTMATGDSVRTGSGSSTRYLVPKTIQQDDGSMAYCVYVARPSGDPGFLDKLAPGNTGGAEIITRQAIPQSEFMRNLRDPALMGSVGGIGNGIANDVQTGAAAFALGALGFTGAAGVEFVRDGAEISEARQNAVKATAKLFDMDAVLDAAANTKVDAIMSPANLEGMKWSAATQRNVRQVVDAVLKARPGDPEFVSKLFNSLASGSPEANAWLIETANRRRLLGAGQRALNDAEVEDLVAAIHRLWKLNEQKLLEVTRIHGAQNKLAGGIRMVSDELSGLRSKLRPAVGDARTQLVTAFEVALRSIDDAVDEMAGPGPLRDALGTDQQKRFAEAIGRGKASGPWAWVPRFSKPSQTAAGRAAADKLQDEMAQKLARVAVPNETFSIDRALVTATKTSDEAAAAARNQLSSLADFCWRGGRLTSAVKVMGCGLVAGAGSLIVKKSLFEPGTMTIKRDQIAEAMTQETESFTDVTKESFEAVTEAIRGFTTQAMTSSCQ